MISNEDKEAAIIAKYQLQQDISTAVSNLVEEYKLFYNASPSDIIINLADVTPVGQSWKNYIVGNCNVTIGAFDE